MGQQVFLHIKEPCHQNWEAMSPAAQGRYCQSCSKQVIDFTGMHDHQILHLLSKAPEKTCGRFLGQQLERPLLKEISHFPSPRKALVTALLPALLVTASASAQEGQLKGEVVITQNHNAGTRLNTHVPAIPALPQIKGCILSHQGRSIAGALVTVKSSRSKTVADAAGNFTLTLLDNQQSVVIRVSSEGYEPEEMVVNTTNTRPVRVIMSAERQVFTGMIFRQVIPSPVKPARQVHKVPASTEIKGRVVNEHNEPMPYASVQISNPQTSCTTDKSGYFSLSCSTAQLDASLLLTYAGYQPLTKKLDLATGNLQDLKLVIHPVAALDTVVVKGSTLRPLSGIAGGLSIVRTVTRADTAKAFVQKLFNNELFKAYPNPAVKGQTINLRFRREGPYALQLFDNSGRLYSEQQVLTESANDTSPFTLPRSLACGVYYLKAVNGATKKQFIEKILVQ